ncbi:MAG: rod shape-determining protein MreD [bacterium]
MNPIRDLLTGFILIVLQITLVPFISIYDVRPDIVLPFIVIRSFHQGSVAGVMWGFCLGFLLDALGSGLPGLGSLVYSIIGFLCGHIGTQTSYTRMNLTIALTLCAILEFFILLYFYEPWDKIGWLNSILFRTLPGIAYTCLVGLLWTLLPFEPFENKESG